MAGAVELLRSVDLFAGLTKRELQRIADAGKEMRFRAGTPVAEEGGPAGRFFLILEGEARVFIAGQPRGRLGPGDYFGEISLIDGGPRTATVTAATDLRTFSLASFNFRPLLLEHPTMTHKILLEMCRRFRDAPPT